MLVSHCMSKNDLCAANGRSMFASILRFVVSRFFGFIAIFISEIPSPMSVSILYVPAATHLAGKSRWLLNIHCFNVVIVTLASEMGSPLLFCNEMKTVLCAAVAGLIEMPTVSWSTFCCVVQLLAEFKFSEVRVVQAH